MRSIARALGLAESFFEEAFGDGNSTLRLIAYPPWPAIASAHGLTLRPLPSQSGAERFDIGGEHLDSGFVTLLQQDSVGGLQARSRDGEWIDVPPLDHSLVVNFGKLLERWSGGRIRATEHRVLGNVRQRTSIPFFFEPRIDARIAPLPLPGAEEFEPFFYGDHLWESMTRFAEFSKARRFPNDRQNNPTR
jgi:isopenicillin N synthase-like dioxygenase